jgi:hypothetical protein
MAERSNTSERVRKHRNALRGRQSLLLIDDRHEDETLGWLDRVADPDRWM